MPGLSGPFTAGRDEFMRLDEKFLGTSENPPQIQRGGDLPSGERGFFRSAFLNEPQGLAAAVRERGNLAIVEPDGMTTRPGNVVDGDDLLKNIAAGCRVAFRLLMERYGRTMLTLA